MVKWYYEKKELRVTPSVQNGLPLETEHRYRREGARFIIDLGSTMNLSLTTMATGVVYYHRFYMFHTFQDFPRYPTACACLFLAGKVEETPKKCKDVIKCANDLLPTNKFNQFGSEPRNWTEEVMTLERILLQTIKFDLQVEHPYTFLLKYAKCLKGDKNRLQKMVQMAWTFVNDSLCTTLCLQWEPEIIAIALMYLAGKLSKFEVVDWDRRKPEHLRWWDMFVEDMSIETLEDICHQVLDLYSQTQQPPPPDSPPPHALPGSNLPIPNAHSTNVSPLANSNTPQAGSKTSTPVQALTPTMPAVAPVTAPVVPSSSSLHPSAGGYPYSAQPLPVVPVPPYQPPPASQAPYSKPGVPPLGAAPIPLPNYPPPSQTYYPPVSSNRSYPTGPQNNK